MNKCKILLLSAAMILSCVIPAFAGINYSNENGKRIFEVDINAGGTQYHSAMMDDSGIYYGIDEQGNKHAGFSGNFGFERIWADKDGYSSEGECRSIDSGFMSGMDLENGSVSIRTGNHFDDSKLSYKDWCEFH